MCGRLQGHAMDTVDQIYSDYLRSLLVGDRRRCKDVVVGLLDSKTSIRSLYEGLFKRSMYEVGRLWETGRISVATEHLATSVTESLLTLVYPQIFAAEHINKSAVISCVANEYHQIGGRMVADMFELSGWNGYFLGANTPFDALAKMIVDKKPDVVGLSLSVYFNMPKLLEATEAVRRVSPQVQIFVGGQAFQWADSAARANLPGVQVVDTLADLEVILHGAVG